MPMFYGQIMMQNYLEDPAISFCAIGDAVTDKCPFQVTEFGQGNEIDEMLGKMYLEGAGGGNAHESYELSAYFYNTYCDIDESVLPFFFVTGDEGYWEEISTTIISNIFGKGLEGDKMNSYKQWKLLMDKFNVFHVKKAYETFPDKAEGIRKQWIETLGEERVLEIVNPKAIVDVMLGAIALTSGKRDLDGYIEDMKTRGQSPERIKEVARALYKYNQKLRSKSVQIVKNDIKILIDNEYLNQIRETYEKLFEGTLSQEDLQYYYKVKNMKSDSLQREFLCPITQNVMFDPVMLSDGNSYEKLAIELWFDKYNCSPVSGVKIDNNIFPNLTLKKLIENKYVEMNK
jgi:hypothetical protein